MSRNLKLILAANLMAIAILVFTYPYLMVEPGKLIPGHKHLEADCFACHEPLRGATAERCTVCHKPAEIGRLTTTGKAIAKSRIAIPFHQKLINQNCVACHSDHAGVQRSQKQGHFNHNLLEQKTAEQCQDCHKLPTDSLHQQITGNCTQCHTQEKWLPATFDHTKYFGLDGDHNVRCVTCHVRNDYSRYTCYGCHEHSPSNIRSEHMEEGIRNFDNCVKCHRSAEEQGIREETEKHEGEHEDD
jgi:hypothetical protein